MAGLLEVLLLPSAPATTPSPQGRFQNWVGVDIMGRANWRRKHQAPTRGMTRHVSPFQRVLPSESFLPHLWAHISPEAILLLLDAKQLPRFSAMKVLTRIIFNRSEFLMQSLILSLTAGLAFVSSSVDARVPAPLSLQSSSWKGVDGNWSTLAFELGSNSQKVDVLVSTALSEFWAVGSGGCLPKSTDWSSLGSWRLGLNYLRYGGNGLYGQDQIGAHSSVDDTSFHMSGVLIAAINTTSYLNGLFGLAIAQGNFGGIVAESPLTQAVKEFGWIPSYSYGYTAGAHYRNVPVSLTLGGYDASRLESHNNDFTLNRDDGIPRARVRGIGVSVNASQDKPADWESQWKILSNWNSSFDAIIDSTTPYLWLPDDVCDRLADAFNLTYDTTFDLYTMTNDQYNSLLDENTFYLTFVLSSFDNKDSFGDPYDVRGIVNITIPSRAFIGQLQYPFMNGTIAYGEPAIPYFMLRRAGNSTRILGRSFLQESYLITKYDEALFRIHQARFPTSYNSSQKDLIPIVQAANSPYPPPKKSSLRLSKGKRVGIAFGAGLALAGVATVIVWLCTQHRKKGSYETAKPSIEQTQATTPATTTDIPKSPFHRMLSMIVKRKGSPRADSMSESETQKLAEAPNSQIYELPAPVLPAELDGASEALWNENIELELNSSQQVTTYEAACRRIDQQLRGPVPAYTPPPNGILPPSEKSIREPSGCQPPSISAMASNSSLHIDESSSVPGSPLLLLSSTQSSEIEGLKPRQSSPDSVPTPGKNPVPAIQQTFIDRSKVICLGPLPENVQPTDPMRRTSSRDSLSGSLEDGLDTYGTLGSNYTVEEEGHIASQLGAFQIQLEELSVSQHKPIELCQIRTRDIEPTGSTTHEASCRAPESLIQQGPGRIDSSTELIHVPQLAERRYSWEE
ncbi:aspartic peptidase domain-containing protein [Mariannaea sp. PMI_226]|nr:aspartic peptidase domain-containing protein [Mariannaea sp. PMI_226]